MLHRTFPEAIARAKKNGLSVGVFSNGSLIEKRQLASSIVTSVDFIRISVDAATPETFSLVRGVDASKFDDVLRGVTELLGERRHLRKDVDIGLKFLASRTNAEEIPQFVDRALELRVDSVQFKPLRGGTHELDEQGLKRVQEMIDQAKRGHPRVREGRHGRQETPARAVLPDPVASRG